MIRKARVDDTRGIAKVHLDTWKSTYKGIVPDDHLTSLSYEKLENGWAKLLRELAPPEIVLVVEKPQEGIVGFGRAGPCASDLIDYDS